MKQFVWRGGIALFACCVAGVKTLPVRAQNTVQASGAPVVDAQSSVSQMSQMGTLSEVLQDVAWDATRRGPLLVVNPQRTYLAAGYAPLPGAGRGGAYRLLDVAPRFGRRIVNLGTLSVLAPIEMVVLNMRPGKPDPLETMGRSEKFQYLLASLNENQWQKLGGEQGLGQSDLSGEQQTVFLSLLPQPFGLRKIRIGKEGARPVQDEKPVTLSQSDKTGVRLRLNQRVSLLLPLANQPQGFSSTSPLDRFSGPEGTEFYALERGAESEQSRALNTLKVSLPNRLKIGHLPFDAPNLSAQVSLTDAANVGDLVQRAGKITGLELYADRRLAKLPVWTKAAEERARGNSAPAGDLLQALCLAVTGTFRKVGPAYVLTNDVEGLGTRHARLAEWLQQVEQQRRELQETLKKRIAQAQSGSYLNFASDDPYAPDAQLQQMIAERRQGMAQGSQGNITARFLPLSVLTPALQAFVHQEAARRSSAGSQPVSTDRAMVNISLYLAYLVPGLGPIEERAFSLGAFSPPSHQSVSPPLPARPQPALSTATMAVQGSATPSARPVTRALYIAPATADEAAQTVQMAKKRGFTQLWIEITHDDGARAPLLAAVRAGNSTGLPVVAVMRLLKLNPTEGAAAPAAWLDKNILGETAPAYATRRAAVFAKQRALEGAVPPTQRLALVQPYDYWLNLDTPTHAQLIRRLTELAGTPGLAGIALLDTTPPGYEALLASEREALGDAQGPYLGTVALGYTPELRLAFLRKEGVDPVDLVLPAKETVTLVDIELGLTYRKPDLQLPFFPDDNAQPSGYPTRTSDMEPLLPQWDAVRRNANKHFLHKVFTAVRSVSPNIPLLLRNVPVWPGQGEWWGSWDRPDVLPRSTSRSAPSPEAMAQTARSQSRRVLLHIGTHDSNVSRGAKGDIADQAPAHLLPTVPPYASGWDGFVLDLSTTSVDGALQLLKD